MTATKPPLYVAVVLDDDSHNRLVDWFPGKLLSRCFAHHMTVTFKPTLEEFEKLPINQSVFLKVIGYADNGKVQTVAVMGFPSSNAIPHITVATDDDTPPKASNDLVVNDFTLGHGPILLGRVLGQPEQPKGDG